MIRMADYTIELREGKPRASGDDPEAIAENGQNLE